LKRRTSGGQQHEAFDTTSGHGTFLFNLFGTPAECERALTTERVNAGLAATRRRGRKGWQAAVDRRRKRIGQIIAALDGGASKASVCRSFKVPRSTLIDLLKRTGWSGVAPERRPKLRPD